MFWWMCGFNKNQCSIMKAYVFCAASVDGFIAKKDGGIDWLNNPDYELPGEDFGFATLMDSIDALIMGRNTFEQLLTFDVWHYSKPVIVPTSRPLEVPKHLKNKVIVASGEPAELMAHFGKQGFQNFYIDGGNTIQRFLRDGLVDRITITRIPILLGEGIPLFGAMHGEITLRLISAKSYPNGFVEEIYEPVNNENS